MREERWKEGQWREPTYWNRHDGPMWMNHSFELAWSLWEATADGTESGWIPVGDRELRYDHEEKSISVAGVFMPDHPALLQGFIQLAASWPAYVAGQEEGGEQRFITLMWEAWGRSLGDGRYEPNQWGEIKAVFRKQEEKK